jgi:hypothetical protein
MEHVAGYGVVHVTPTGRKVLEAVADSDVGWVWRHSVHSATLSKLVGDGLVDTIPGGEAVALTEKGRAVTRAMGLLS